MSASRSAPARDVSQTAESGPGPDLESIAEALIVKGREQGSLTFDDLAQGFLEVLLESNDLARVTAAFTEMGINVIEHESDLEMAAVGDAVSLLTADEEIVRSRRKRCTSYERRAAPPSFAPF